MKQPFKPSVMDQTQSTGDAGSQKDYPTTIDAETAARYVAAWQKGDYNIVPSSVTPGTSKTLQLDSFVFSIDDFKDFVSCVDKYNEMQTEENQVNGTVCRLGLKVNPLTGEGLVPAMFFEPVVGYSRTPPTGGYRKPDLSPVEVSARYDFSYPCPPTCSA